MSQNTEKKSTTPEWPDQAAPEAAEPRPRRKRRVPVEPEDFWGRLRFRAGKKSRWFGRRWRPGGPGGQGQPVPGEQPHPASVSADGVGPAACNGRSSAGAGTGPPEGAHPPLRQIHRLVRPGKAPALHPVFGRQLCAGGCDPVFLFLHRGHHRHLRRPCSGKPGLQV